MISGSQGILVLEDGSVFHGRSVAAEGEWVGEVVFNTAVAGYQEVLTDPSYWGQMVCFTYPHLGNVGVNASDDESGRVHVRAVIARQISRRPSNWRSTMGLPEYLLNQGVPALEGIDTRRLTLLLREGGVMRAALSTVSDDVARLLDMARQSPVMSVLRPIPLVSRQQSEAWVDPAEARWVQFTAVKADLPGIPPHVVVMDCGVKANILRTLLSAGARVTVVPHDTSATQVVALQPDGLLIANGPGDPERAGPVIDAVRELMQAVPVLGICMGQQVLALAAGARTYKMRFGHHGDNHPVQSLLTGAIEITSQNHNYAVDADSFVGLPLEVTHRNLYDGTVEGLRHKTLPVASVQFHPEAAPGPHDSLHIIYSFAASLSETREA